VNYRVFILPRAQKEWERLPKADYWHVKVAILALAQNPRPPGSKKLSGRDGWRIRQGDYRVIYEIDDDAKTVTVLRVRHRREAYN
jgi:mRNA interferase RelE/StbE